jgi:hypothetical protein
MTNLIDNSINKLLIKNPQIIDKSLTYLTDLVREHQSYIKNRRKQLITKIQIDQLLTEEKFFDLGYD